MLYVTPSTRLRTRWPGVVRRLMPIQQARASGSGYGHRSPLRNGRKKSPSLPAGTFSACLSRVVKIWSGLALPLGFSANSSAYHCRLPAAESMQPKLT